MNWIENRQDVVSDIIDGEMVLLHLKAGHYFSMNATASALWETLQKGASEEAIVGQLAERFPEQPQLAEQVRAWFEQLRQEQLIVPCEQVVAPAQVVFEGAYAAPELNKYTDLQDLLLIDPIHESDAAGWPAMPTPPG